MMGGPLGFFFCFCVILNNSRSLMAVGDTKSSPETLELAFCNIQPHPHVHTHLRVHAHTHTITHTTSHGSSDRMMCHQKEKMEESWMKVSFC